MTLDILLLRELLLYSNITTEINFLSLFTYILQDESQVHITPYRESASEANIVAYTQQAETSRNLNHGPVIIVPEELTTSEPELVCPSMRYHNILTIHSRLNTVVNFEWNWF